MGASYVNRTYADCTAAELKDKVSDDCDSDARESGHGGYTGTWAEKRGDNVTIKNVVYATLDAADECIMNEADKWGNLIAAKYKHGEGTRWVVGAWCSS
jgi:hypothetical protein